MLQQSISAFILLFLALPFAWAQDSQKNDQSPVEQPTGVAFGVALRLGYSSNPVGTTAFSSIPESLRTVNYGSGETYTFSQDQLNLHPGLMMIPIEFGPSIIFGNRFALAFGGLATVTDDTSNRMQIGCYCVGSTVTYIQLRTTPVRIGGFGEVSVRIKGRTWFTAEASSTPVWSNIVLRQGYSEYGGDKTLLQEQIANYRTPLTALAGLKFCIDCGKDAQAMLGFSAGVAYWQNHVNSTFAGIQYPPSQQFLVFEGFIEYNNFFKIKRKK